MKLLRTLLISLALLAAIAVTLAAVALVPAVQTWAVQFALSEANIKGSVGSVTAGFGRVDITDLKLERSGAVLTVPSLTARLPVCAALWNRRFPINSLEAKGWTLDLSRAGGPQGPRPAEAPAPATAASGSPAPASAARGALRAFGVLLGAWTFPCDGSLDGAELEGDVLVSTDAARAPAKVHVILAGGGLGEDREGSFVLDAATTVADREYAANDISAHGRLVVATGPQRTLSRMTMDAELADTSGRIPKGQNLSVGIARGPSAGEIDCAFELGRASQHLVSVLAHIRGAAHELSGSWTLDVRDADLAVLFPDNPLPSFTAAGSGTFDADYTLDRIHLLGRLNAKASHLGVLYPALEQMGAVGLDARFDGIQKGLSLRVDRASLSVGGAEPIALLQSLQTFDVDEAEGRVSVADPAKDWMEVSLHEVPLAWLSEVAEPWAFNGGVASGSFVVRAGDKGLSAHSTLPVTATGVTLSRSGAVFGKNLGLTGSLQAHWSNPSWSLQLSQLKVASGGRALAALDLTATRSDGADPQVQLSGTWSADLDSLTAAPAFPFLAGITAHSASGAFTAILGPVTKFDGTVALVGHDPAHKLDATPHLDVYGDGSVEFKVPAKISLGPSVSDVSLDGTWTPDPAGAQLGVELSGSRVELGHLKLLAASLGRLRGGQSAPAQAPEPLGSGARLPFWGADAGSVMVVIDRLISEEDEYKDVRGTLEFERAAIHIKRGRCSLAHHTLENIDGLLSFDASAEVPYSLTAAASAYDVDAAALFAAPKDGPGPTVEGHFSVVSTLVGKGRNFEDLVAQTRVEYRMKSPGGIFRALDTNVGDAIPEAKTPVADTLGSVGNAMVTIFGVKGDLGAKNRVSKTAEAIMQFTYNVAEIGYDQATLTAIEEPDRSIRIEGLSLTAPEERISGSGRISFAKGLPLRDQPLSLDLDIWVRGKTAELLSSTGLLSTRKDAQGYTLLVQPVHFAGTPGNIDQSQWHDLLAKAARPNPDAPKKVD